MSQTTATEDDDDDDVDNKQQEIEYTLCASSKFSSFSLHTATTGISSQFVVGFCFNFVSFVYFFSFHFCPVRVSVVDVCVWCIEYDYTFAFNCFSFNIIYFFLRFVVFCLGVK